MGVDIINQRNVRTAYSSIRQGRYESILEFRRRFTYISAAFAQVVGGQVPPLQQSVDFIHALDDRRYAQFKADIQNEAVAGQPWPPTLQDAYTRAALYKRVDLKHV